MVSNGLSDKWNINISRKALIDDLKACLQSFHFVLMRHNAGRELCEFSDKRWS